MQHIKNIETNNQIFIVKRKDSSIMKRENISVTTFSRKGRLKRHIVPMAAGIVTAASMLTMPVHATGVSEVLNPINNLKTLVLAIIGAVGVIILAKNVMEFAQAYQQQDSSSMNSALKGIVAGLIMAGISAVMTFLGF